jgi:hypothetical protein
MRRIIVLVALAAAVAVAAVAQTPAENPFPSAKVPGMFVRATTWTTPTSHYLTNYFPQGSEVAFRMFVGDNKTRLSMTNKELQYARIVIPGQPAVQMKYTNTDPQYPWEGVWTVPTDYAPGIVAFQASVKAKGASTTGTFTQIPVATSQLTVTAAG